jgi:hypothetical protein
MLYLSIWVIVVCVGGLVLIEQIKLGRALDRDAKSRIRPIFSGNAEFNSFGFPRDQIPISYRKDA